MKRKIIETADGSHTIAVPELNEHYHSVHGAINEAKHVYLKHGLNGVENNPVTVLEIGFGTGLNALLTYVEAEKLKRKVYYQSVEAYPVDLETISHLNYVDKIEEEGAAEKFNQLHLSNWEEEVILSDNFTFKKQKRFFNEINESNKFDVIYFDAFGPEKQPELWTEEIFTIMYNSLKEEGILVTYSAKGAIKRAMKAAGFKIEALPGPPGKREMTRAIKE